jgi:hypothetical protein
MVYLSARELIEDD